VTTTAVHQILPSLHVADASGAHTLHARDALRAAGFASELFVTQVDEPLAGEAHHVDELDTYVVPDRTVLIYQLAVGSAVVDRLIRRPEPLVVNYHNLTPASFFWRWAPEWLDAVQTGRDQLHRLAPHVAHAIAVSRFNERDLLAAGYRSTSVVPPFVDVRPASLRDGPPRHRDGPTARTPGTRWLFVGKLLPHKAAHDVVSALAAYRRAYDPGASLVLVGGHPVASYAAAVTGYARALGLADAVDLTGSVSAGELEDLYAASDVFVCLSDHEGFCFPVLEAMAHRLPVVALDAGAVADTVGTAGIVLDDKMPSRVAAAVHRVQQDAPLRARLVSAGLDRLRVFDLGRTGPGFVAAVQLVVDRVWADAPERRAS
jgi:glycosyltransferase involved in cell wall biosynthesis